MKTTILAIILGLSFNLSAQKKDTSSVSQDMNKLKYCLYKSHKEFRIGSELIIGGVIISSVGTYMGVFETNDNIKYSIIGTGGLLTAIGAIIIADSHKWIGRAGIGFDKDGIGIKYKFK